MAPGGLLVQAAGRIVVSVPCVWWNVEPTAPARGPYWDRALLEDVLSGVAWRVPGAVEFDHIEPQNLGEGGGSGMGAVVVVPARQNVDNLPALRRDLYVMPWVLLLVTGDESDVFDWRALSHPRMEVWKMGGRSALMSGCAQPLGSGYPPWLREMLHGSAPEKSRDWFFSGQANHAERVECLEVLGAMEGGKAVETDGFTQGLPPHEYVSWLASAKVAPCPSGQHTPDTFRCYEALEAGCIPVVSDRDDPGYWTYLLDGDPPFPVIARWDRLYGLVPELLARWPHNANRVGAWWMARKRTLAYRLHDAIARLSGAPRVPSAPSDEITVVIPTSPCVVHPDLDPMREVVRSIRAQLPHAEIVIAADGVRDEQGKFTDVYDEYLRRLVWACHHEWSNVVPLLRDDWGHQANTTRDALAHVTTPLVLFCEHDTPLLGDIDWDGFCRVVHSGEADVIRLYPEVEIHPEHEHLMLDPLPRHPHGVPLRRTAQWSQRPHLARTLWYQSMLTRYFSPDARTMIEDCLYGVVEHYWLNYHEPGWEQWRLWIYQPEGDIKRSGHLDTRGAELKFDMRFAYPGEVPEGAPTPT